MHRSPPLATARQRCGRRSRAAHASARAGASCWSSAKNGVATVKLAVRETFVRSHAAKPLPGDEVLRMIPAHPHNWVVEVMAETGALGLLALLFTLVFFYVYLLLKYRKTGEAGYLMAILVFAGYWTSGLFNFSYWSAWWQLSFVLTTAFALSAFSAKTSKN